MNGILLALQFFTVLPIRKELPLGRKEVTAMYLALPFVGATMGLSMYGVSELMLGVFEMGPLLTAVFIVLTGIVMTGGLHLDGWADTGDAFFSYQDRDKRLEILEDPRLGAFGTMALVLLILVKVALFHEVLLRGFGSMALFVAIPFLTRVAMNICFTTLKSAKNKGIAYFFKEKIGTKQVLIGSVGSGVVMLIGLGYLIENFRVSLLLFGVIVIGIFLFRNWAKKHFGGITGDLAGAFIEGMEAVLWLVVLGSL